MSGTPDLLEAIIAATRTRVAHAKERIPLSVLERRAWERKSEFTSFIDRVGRPESVNIIAECKRRSPSRGILRAAYDPVEIALGYERAGAAAISVLTEPGFFDGSLDHLAAIRSAVKIPILRKDFVVDKYQIVEARAAGADAILLIVAALDDATLRTLLKGALEYQLAALVEVHSVDECRRALDIDDAILIGVNNRNLRTLQVDLNASREIAQLLPEDVVAVSESGLKTPADLQAMKALGYRAFLMGERFMIEPDPGAALSSMIAALETEPAHRSLGGGAL